MKTGRNLQEVLVELNRQNQAKQDFISPAQGMHLREDGHTVHIAALEGEGLAPEPLGPGLALAHCVILPLPVTQREEILHTPLSEEEVTLSQVLDYMEAGQILCGGLVSPAVRAAGPAGL